MFKTTKKIVLGSCAFRQPKAKSHCRFLHGYNLYAKFEFQCVTLNENGWVIDFGGFKELKAQLRKTFDHTTIIKSTDPELKTFRSLEKKGIIDLRTFSEVGIEAFAKYCCNKANNWLDEKYETGPESNTDFIRLSKGHRKIWCSRVEVWEHKLNSSIFESNTSLIK